MFDAEHNIGIVLITAYRKVQAELRQELAAWNITPPQFYLLTFLWRNDGQLQVELAKRSGIDRTTTCGIIDRLETSGYVTRRFVANDRRAHRIELTEKGRSLETDLCRAVDRAHERIVARITPKGYLQLQSLLDRLVVKNFILVMLLILNTIELNFELQISCL
jgi:DNA-binding MarR family transcriptional regulator